MIDIRKFRCFVCSIEFEQFDEYKNHILESHEEGQDYIKCPVEYCQAPIRCMRSHFKAKHPHLALPKTGMLKAIVWRDIASNGKMKRKNKFREGWHESTKMGKNFYFRSGYEKSVFELLDSWHRVMAYEVEPFAIPYIHEGSQHNYTPDVFISFIDGKIEIWEIKPASQTLLEKNQNKWFSAKRACEAKGWGFEVITEQTIEKLKKTVKNQYM